MIFTALQEEVLMKKVLDTYSSKNDINIKQIVAYKIVFKKWICRGV